MVGCNVIPIFLITVLSLFSNVTLATPTVSVQATVDRNEMGLGDSVQVTVSVTSSESVDVQEPRVPNLNGFNLLNSGSSTSTSTKLVQGPNGMQFQTQKRYDFIYLLGAQQKGKITIPAFEVQVNGKNYFTKPIVMTVLPEGSGATLAPRGQRPGLPQGVLPDEEDIDEADRLLQEMMRNRGQLPADPQFRTAPKNQNEAFFIQLELDKKEVYEGEQITASWYILTRGALMSLDRLKFPDLKGFWKEIIEEVPALNFSQEIINGVAYKKALLASHALFPIKAGDVVIDEYKVKASVALPTNPFSSFGLGKPYTYTKSSERVPIKVHPIPTENRPTDFAGAVGNFTVNAAVEGDKFYVNQPLSLKVRFEGEGNAKMIELPALSLPSIVEVYDTKSESKFFKNGKSYKQFDVLVIPRQKGLLEIPVMSFSFFDSKTKKFVTTKTQAMRIEVLEALAGTMSENARLKLDLDQPKSTVSENILVPYASLESASWISLDGPQAKWVWIFIYLVIAIVLLWKAKKELFELKQKKDIIKEVKKRLQLLQQQVKSADYRKFGTSGVNLLYLVLNEVSSSSVMQNDEKLSQSTNSSLEQWLQEAPPTLRNKHGDGIVKLMNHLQSLSFAPESALGNAKSQGGLKEQLDLLEKLIFQLLEFKEK